MRLISFLSFFIFSLNVYAIDVTFKVNMSLQIDQGVFNPASDFVDVAGTFNGWGGTLTKLSDTDGDSIYDVVISGFTENQQIEFKFRHNGQWNGREEFPGVGNNRMYQVIQGSNTLEFWYNNERPEGAEAIAIAQASNVSFFEDAVIRFQNQSQGDFENTSWTFEGGYPSTSNVSNPNVFYPNPGNYISTLKITDKNSGATKTSTQTITVKPRDTNELDWWNETTFYEIFVRSFKDSDGDGIGDFDGITEKIDYIKGLGVEAIWLMPIHPSPSYHGYDVQDYRTVSTQYGGMDQFKNFLAVAKENGIKVIIDFVMNHSSSQHPWFLSSQSPSSSKRDWYTWKTSNPNFNGPWGQQVWHPINNQYFYGLFWSGMPDLNYDNAALKSEMFDIADYWLNDIGIDGFRLDAVKFIHEDGMSLEDTPRTFSFWKEYQQNVKSSKASTFSVGEAWTGTDQVTDYVLDDGLDICFDFDLANAIINGVNSTNSEDIIGQIQKAYNVFPHNQFGIFLSNHDINRVIESLGYSEQKLKTAMAIQMTIPGVPFTYYGNEIGMTGKKPDEYIRTPMLWDDSTAAGFTDGFPWIAPNSNYRTKNVATLSTDESSVLNHYKKLAQLRNQNDALAKGGFRPIYTTESTVIAYERTYEDEQFIVIINLSDQNKTIDLDYKFATVQNGSYTLINLMNDAITALDVANEITEGLWLEGREIKILKKLSGTATDNISRTLALDIYPNPSSNEINLLTLDHNLPANFKTSIIDASGKLVKLEQSGNRQINVSELTEGLYYLIIQYANERKIGKFVKN